MVYFCSVIFNLNEKLLKVGKFEDETKKIWQTVTINFLCMHVVLDLVKQKLFINIV